MQVLTFFFAKLLKKILVSAVRNSTFHKTSKVCSCSNILDSDVNKYSYIGSYCTVVNTEIGSFCSIADNCIIGGAMHPINFVSTSPVFCEGKNVMKKNFYNHHYCSSERTVIGDDVWIGNNCLIKQGVKVGNGAIIGMGAVVTKDVLPYSIIGGNPAKLIRMRFDNDIVENLLKINWYNSDDLLLTKQAYLFNDIDNFIKHNNDKL